MKAEGTKPCEAHPILSKARCEQAAQRLMDGNVVGEGGICSPDKTPCTITFADDSTTTFTAPDSALNYPNGCYYYNDKHDGGDGSGGVVRWNPQFDTDGTVIETQEHQYAHPICIYVPDE